jgi:hypothetical protein
MNILTGFKTCRKGLHQYPTGQKQCPECAKIQYEKTREERRLYKIWWRQQNSERVIKNNKEHHEKNKEKINARKRRQYQVDPTVQKNASAKWRNANRDKIREQTKQWRINNKDKDRAATTRRRAAKKRAIPKWASQLEINKIYQEAVRLTETIKIEYQVDHIYPLTSKFLCGLHVETNLQILTKKENSTKGNWSWPGQLECQKGSVYAIFPKELTDLLND